MLYNSLKEELEKNPDLDELKYCSSQYEKQREFFLRKRLELLSENYRLNQKEKKIITAYFNTSERYHEKNKNSKIKTFRILSTFKNQNKKQDFVDDNPINIPIVGWLRIYWSDAWREYAWDHRCILSAKFAITRLKKENIDDGYFESAVNDLTCDLKQVLPVAEKFIGLPLLIDGLINPKTDKSGILIVDKKKVKWLQQNNIGVNFKKCIAKLKALISSKNYNANKRIDIWDNPLYFSRELAVLRWKDCIETFVKRKRNNPPALTLNFASQISKTISKNAKLNKLGNNLLDCSGKKISAFDPSACLNLVTIESILGKRISALSSKGADYSIRWMVKQGSKQHYLDIKEPNKIEIIGGWERFSEVCGAGTTTGSVDSVKLAIAALAGCGYEHESREGVITGNLLSYEHIRARGRRNSKLTLTLSRPLCPGFVEELPNKRTTKYNRERFLVPVVDMPAFYGEAKTYANQSNFQWHLLIEMRLRAVEVYQRGGILLSGEDILNIARKARLSADMINNVVDLWISESYLEKIEDCVYFLGPRYPDAQKMLKEAGESQVLGAEAGRKQKRIKKARFSNFKEE